MSRLLAFTLAMVLVLPATAAQVEIRLKDGSRWRGQVNDQVHVEFNMQGVTVSMEGKLTKVEDLYVQVDGTFAGAKSKKTIFKSDIVNMKTLGAGPGTSADGQAAVTSGATGEGELPAPADEATPIDKNAPGVFFLPLKGMVGEGFRSEEMNALAKHCDKYGPGQIIVIEIESGGGLAIEMERIHYAIKEIRKRHRMVAWIREAISAAAATAMNCDEIYFTSTGTLGAMTMFAGGVSAKGEELEKWMNQAARIAELGGRSKYIAWAMIDDEALLSYDKDPETGEVTWHNDLSGQVVLSDAKTNLVFNASSAMDCGFADGIADTKDELAALLNLPGGKWNEKDDYGRKISKDWLALVEKAKEEIPLQFARYDYKGAASGAKAKIGVQIGIIKDLIRWWDRCPNVCLLSGVPPKPQLERELEELKRIMARMNN
jgi:ClpP class serine protease